MEERRVRRRVLGGLASIFAGLAAVAEALSQGDEETEPDLAEPGTVLHTVAASSRQRTPPSSPPRALHAITVLRERLWCLQ